MQVYDKLVSDITSLEAELSVAVQANKFAKAASVQDELVVLIDDLIDAKESELLTLIATANFFKLPKNPCWNSDLEGQTRQMPITDKGQEERNHTRGHQ